MCNILLQGSLTYKKHTRTYTTPPKKKKKPIFMTQARPQKSGTRVPIIKAYIWGVSQNRGPYKYPEQ